MGAHARAATDRQDHEPGLNFLQEGFEADVTLAKAAIALEKQQRDEVIKKLVDTYRPPGQPAKRQSQAPKKRVS